MEKKHILSVLVNDTPGLLIRVAGLFSRRGYSIESIAASQTENPNITRMTIVVNGNEETLEQIEKQLSKLIDVIDIAVLDSSNSVFREHAIVKVDVTDLTRPSIIEIANLFRASILDVGAHTMMLELAGEPRTIQGFVNLLKPYGINQLMKTGVSALQREV